MTTPFFLFVTFTEATHNLTPLPPPPPPLEGEDTEMASLPVETRRAMSDDDLDMSVHLGEAVISHPRPNPHAHQNQDLHLPYFLSLLRDATSIPPIDSRQLGKRGGGTLFPSECIGRVHALNVIYVLAAGTDHPPLSPSPSLLSSTTVEPSSR